MTSYKIQETAQIFPEEWGDGCSLTDRKGCISGGLARDRNQGVISQVVRVMLICDFIQDTGSNTTNIYCAMEWGVQSH